MIALLLTLAFIVLTAMIDADFLKAGYRFESHASRVLLRLTFVIAASHFNTTVFIGSGLLVMILFSPALSLLLGKGFFHLGSTAKWDRFWSKRPVLYKLTTLAGIGAGVTLMFT